MDLDTGEVYKQNNLLTHNDVSKCDSLFISKILKLKKISQEKIKKSFANYTKMQLEMALLPSEKIQHIKDEIDVDFFNNISKLKNSSFI